jgi:hypothetical protein
MQNILTWETKNVSVLLAVIAAAFILTLWLSGESFSCKVCDVIMTMLQ